MIGIVRERLERPDAAGGFVLDGFPRTVRAGRGARRDHGRSRDPLIVVDIVVPEEELVRRLGDAVICDGVRRQRAGGRPRRRRRVRQVRRAAGAARRRQRGGRARAAEGVPPR